MKSESIVIVGGGLVGRSLAQRLARDGHDVTVVEADASRIRELSDTLDVQVIEGNGATAAVLRAAGAEHAGLVVASTNSDECNLVVGLLAVRLFGVARVVVRVHDPDHEEAFALVAGEEGSKRVCVNPDSASVERLATLMEVAGALDVVAFMDGELLVAGFTIGPESDFAGLRVPDMSLLFAATPTLAVAIRRGDDWIVPGGDEEIRQGDMVYFAIARSDLEGVLSLVGVPRDPRRRVMIAGATPIGLGLARRLRARGLSVVVIEPDAAKAERAAERLDDTPVLLGRATDQSLLEDEEIEGVSAFVAVTADHETNLVAALLAKRLGAGRTFALVDNPALVALVDEIRIDAIISPRSITIGLTLQHIRGAGVRSGAALLEDRIEIMEVEAAAGTRLTSGPLKDVKLPRGVLVAAVRRGPDLLVPRGEDSVQPGDLALLITTTDLAQKVTEYLRAS